MMRWSAGCILALALLILSQFLLPHILGTQTSTPVKIGIDVGHGNLHTSPSELSNFTALLVANGAQVLYNTGLLNSTYLSSIDALIISSPQTNYTQVELAALTSWYTSTGRLWLSASYENVSSATSLNSVLYAVGSGLRFEYGYASDPLFNLNSSQSDGDQVLLPLINHQEIIPALLTTGVRSLYAYRPVPIITVNGTSYATFNESLDPNDIWIAETSSMASVLNSSSTNLLAYGRNTPARIPVAVVERTSSSKIAVTSSPFFAQWMQQFTYNPIHPYDNRVFTLNLLHWLTGVQISTEVEARIPQIRGTTQPQIIIYTGSLSQHTDSTELQPTLNLLTDMGFVPQTLAELSFSSIQNATAMIIETPQSSFTTDELNAISLWMHLANRTLILASMADYSTSGNATVSHSLNGILSDLQSSLRFEQGSLYDPEVNLGGDATLALASNLNHLSPSLVNLARNIRSLSMQFGTILAGSNQTNFLPLEDQTVLDSLTNVTWIAKTSNQSYVSNLDRSIPMQTHKQGQRGSYIVAALERYRADKYNDTILLTGGPIFTDFSLLLEYPTLFGYPTDNLLFLRNLFTSLLKQTEIKTQLSAAASPSQLSEGGNVAITVQYDALFKSTSNLTEADRVPISPANITMTLGGVSLTPTKLPNQTYSGTSIPVGTGSISWTVSAAAKSYQSQSGSGTVQVNALATRFAPYVLSIPIVVFIAVTIAVVARKTR